MAAQRHHRRGGRRDRAVDHVVRALRLSRVARRELRAHRLRERVPEGALSRRRSTPRCSTTSRWASTIRRRSSRTRSATASASAPIDVQRLALGLQRRGRRRHPARAALRRGPARGGRGSESPAPASTPAPAAPAAGARCVRCPKCGSDDRADDRARAGHADAWFCNVCAHPFAGRRLGGRRRRRRRRSAILLARAVRSPRPACARDELTTLADDRRAQRASATIGATRSGRSSARDPAGRGVVRRVRPDVDRGERGDAAAAGRVASPRRGCEGPRRHAAGRAGGARTARCR